MIVDWHKRLLDAFRRVVANEGTSNSNYSKNNTNTRSWILCTDPYHDGYRIDLAEATLESWERIAVPDGDYTLFSTENLKNGVFIHPWQPSVCIFGLEMLRELGMLSGELGKGIVGLGEKQRNTASKDDGELELPVLFRASVILKGATFS